MTKQRQNSQLNKHQIILYGLAFTAVLLAILYAQFSYIFLENNKYNQQTNKDNEAENEESIQMSQIKSEESDNQSINIDQEIQNSQDDDSEDLDLVCFEIFEQKIQINLKMLLIEVSSDIDRKLQDVSIKKQEIIRQYEILSKQNLDYQQIKQKFQQMENIFNNQNEESTMNSNVEEAEQNSQNDQNELLLDKERQKKDSYLNKLPKQILQKILCFVEHYDEYQHILSFEVLKYSEFIENEYYLIKWENKNTFYDLIIHLHSLLQLKEQINWQIINQEAMEANSTLIYFAKLLLSDLFNFYKEYPNLFQYTDPYEQELIDIKNSLPMNYVIKNLVDQWEENWLQMDISYSSHLSAKREEKRQERFEQIMQNSQFSNDRLKQKANKNSQKQENPINIEESLMSQGKLKSEQEQTKLQPEAIKRDSIQFRQDDMNQQFKNFDEKNYQQLDLNEKAEQNQRQESSDNKQNSSLYQEIQNLFDEEISSQNDFNDLLIDIEKDKTKKRLNVQKRVDIKKIIEIYSEEDSDEITTLEEKVQELWNSKEWRRIFYDLQYNNYFLAKKKI
ncbi:hypothetical protein TTHERM_00030070 (macronuclear) [Tetrahymena thermophila SB210]|uniref:Transmembrane protein n=1 Tax=Tetrahymena thermophila (strain SB210) TaxID=312017 RepID=Q22MW6_TETTS|nr:hypothetical protein TTHERM_00030070 [Tetrahymena thermophila SB210]EAR86627.2 hypothetical protein TTHERM_00030070 [Tetrahymena thermophila SB210]|eukprot:XP_976904.2 hypothetical protein TTHERM_00030070 [Tetrahymena thermophila SB210]